MSSWTSGYVTDIGYTYGYYTELNPQRIQLAFLNNGLVAPRMGVACELGFGQGMSANLHAAAAPIRWYGTDFNPSQAGFAQELAAQSGADAMLFDDSFAEFARRTDLPDFDFIGVHGIWSWISDENRSVIVDFVRRKLKVGGVLYISYNTFPGWAAFSPMRHLMTEHSEVLGAEGRGIVNRIDGAIDFAEKLLATNPHFLRANPLVGERLQKMKAHSRHYLAHEYFNRDWHPMHFAAMADWLAPAKVQYACSASYFDHVEAINLTTEQQQFLAEIPDPMFRQTVRDFMVNQQFRKDYWVKGARSLNRREQLADLRRQRFLLVTPRAEVALKVQGALGEANLTDSIYQPILDQLAGHQVTTLSQIEQALQGQVTFAQLAQALVILVGAGHVVSAQPDADIERSVTSTEKLNRHLMNLSCASNEFACLASPVSGGGVPVGRFEQLFILANRQGRNHPDEWAQFAWEILKSQGQRLLKDGQRVDREEDNLTALTEQAQAFLQRRVAILKALRVI